MTNEEYKRKFAQLTPENKKAILEYQMQLLAEQTRSMTREEAKALIADLTEEEKRKLYELLKKMREHE